MIDTEKYSEQYIEKILSIFVKNNVKLEFLDAQNLLNVIREFEILSTNEGIKSIFDQSKRTALVELDVINKKVISVGVGYPYSTASLSYYPQVKYQLEIISDLFSFNPRASIDLFDYYMIMYSGDDRDKLEGFYYSLDPGILLDVKNESRIEIFDMLKISKKGKKFISNTDNTLIFDYIGFDLENRITKISFTAPKETVKNSKLDQIFNNYLNISEVLLLFEECFDKTQTFTVQYEPDKENYFAIETSIAPQLIKSFSEELYSRKIITLEEKNNFCGLNISENYINSVVKFRWEDKDTFCVKLYLEKLLDGQETVTGA